MLFNHGAAIYPRHLLTSNLYPLKNLADDFYQLIVLLLQGCHFDYSHDLFVHCFSTEGLTGALNRREMKELQLSTIKSAYSGYTFQGFLTFYIRKLLFP